MNRTLSVLLGCTEADTSSSTNAFCGICERHQTCVLLLCLLGHNLLMHDVGTSWRLHSAMTCNIMHRLQKLAPVSLLHFIPPRGYFRQC